MPIPTIPSIPSIPSIGGAGGGIPDATQQFLWSLYGISPGNLRALWFPLAGDTTTTTAAFDGRVWTADGNFSARIVPAGNGVYVTFNGTSQEFDTPDTPNVSFGNGLVDSPCSFFGLGNVTDTAAARAMLNKGSPFAPSGEYFFGIDASDGLMMRFVDNSVPATISRNSNAPITQGAPALFGASYSGSGSQNGITLYQNGALITSTGAVSGAYVAMEDTATVLQLANSAGTRFFPGNLYVAGIYAANLTAAQHLAIRGAVNVYYGLSLS